MGIKIRQDGQWVEVASGSGSSGGSGGGGEPVGTIVAWSGTASNIPTGYQLCDGGSAQTSALQAITGANVPDLRDRFIVGASDISGTGTYPGVGVGSTGGAATHTLTIAEIPSHNHGTNPNNSATMTVGDGAYDIPQYGGNNYTGGGQPHNNLPPYYALCYIIKHTATSGSSGSGSGFVILPEKSATGTSVEFTGIPSDAQELTLMLLRVSPSGLDDLKVQLGTSSGYITSGYYSSSENAQGTVDPDSTDSFIIMNDIGDTSSYSGSMVINKSSDTSYTQFGGFYRANDAGCDTYGDLQSVSGTIDRLRIIFSGTNTFDAGKFGLSYKTGDSGGSGGGVGIGSTSKIVQGNTVAEVVDTGTNGHFKVLTEGTERFRIDNNGNVNFYDGGTQYYGSISKNSSGSFELLGYTNLDLFADGTRISIDQIGVGINSTQPTAELDVNGKVALGSSVYDSNGDTGTSGQVLSSVPGIGVSWTDQTGGSGGSSDPVGTIVAWAGSVSTIPSDYQLCDGSAAQTSALQAITGANVPDLKSRFIVGAHNVTGTGTWPNVGVGSTGGEATHTLTVDEMPSHNHPFSNGDYYWKGDSSQNPDFSWNTGTVYELTTTPSVSSQGGGQAHNNLPPYYALCYIIKHTATSGSAANTVSSDAMVLQAEQSATGTSVEFTGIPSDALEITLMFNGVSLNGSNDYLVQLGTSSGYITSGYVATSQNEKGDSQSDSIEGFIIFSANSGDTHHGKFDINKFSNTTYTFEGQTSRSTVAGTQSYGSLNSISGTITKLKIKPTGTNTFDAGSFSLSYKTPGSANNEGTDAGQGFFENDTTLNSSKTLPANKNVGIFGPYTIGNNVTLTVPTGTTFTVV